jgi:hypothetical protein
LVDSNFQCHSLTNNYNEFVVTRDFDRFDRLIIINSDIVKRHSLCSIGSNYSLLIKANLVRQESFQRYFWSDIWWRIRVLFIRSLHTYSHFHKKNKENHRFWNFQIQSNTQFILIETKNISLFSKTLNSSLQSKYFDPVTLLYEAL